MADDGPEAAATVTGIPRCIHQIWLGNNPRPKLWMDSVEKFAAEHGYEYRVWTEKDVDSLPFSEVEGLRAEYAKFADELAGRADILRMLILYVHGGIYIDADSVIVKPEKFAKFLEKNRAGMFFGWEELSKERLEKLGNVGATVRRTRKMVANGLIGAVPRHPFLKVLLEGAVKNSRAKRAAGEGEAWRQVGPLYVTQMYHDHKDRFPDMHIYPMRYFYAQHWAGIRDPELHKKVRIPGESMLFQYGYSTNGFKKIFAARARRRTRRLGRKETK